MRRWRRQARRTGRSCFLVVETLREPSFPCTPTGGRSTYYLLHLEVTWAKVYETEPLAGITDPREQALVLGAEVCKWGETTDASVFDEVVWPRLAAAAETWWSPFDANRTAVRQH